MNFGTITGRFWTGATGKKMRAQASSVRVVAMYLLTSPHANQWGLYHLPLAYAAADTGLTETTIAEALGWLSAEGFAHYDHDREVVWVVNMAREQNGQLRPNDNRVKFANAQLHGELARMPFAREWYAMNRETLLLGDPPWQSEPTPLEAPSEGVTKPLRSQDQYNLNLNAEDKISGLQPEAPPAFKLEPSETMKQARTDAASFVAWFNRTFDRRFQLSRQLVADVKALTRQGYTERDLRLVALHRRELWAADPKMAAYLEPSTLLRASNFGRYIEPAREWERRARGEESNG